MNESNYIHIRFLSDKFNISDLPNADPLKLTHKKVIISAFYGGSFEGIIHNGIAKLLINQSGWVTIWFSQYNEHLQIQTFEFDHHK